MSKEKEDEQPIEVKVINQPAEKKKQQEYDAEYTDLTMSEEEIEDFYNGEEQKDAKTTSD